MLIATESVVYEMHQDGDTPMPACEGTEVRRVAEGASVSAVALATGDIVLLRESVQEVLETGIEEQIWSLLLLSEDPVRLLVGTEAPHIYHVDAVGEVRRNESFASLECRDQWRTPWGGPPVARSMAASTDGYVYAGIEQGSIMRSPNHGEDWEPVTPDLNADIHQVVTSRTSAARVYADTAAAVYLSEDHGDSWQHISEQLDNRYGRAIAVHPKDADLFLATVSDGPHGDNVHGQLWRTNDAGRNWAHVEGVFPSDTRENIDTYHVAFDALGTAWACVGKNLYAGRDRATMWKLYWSAPDDINVLSCK